MIVEDEISFCLSATEKNNFQSIHDTNSSFHVSLYSKSNPEVRQWSKNYVTNISNHPRLMALAYSMVFIQQNDSLEILNSGNGTKLFSRPCENAFIFPKTIIFNSKDSLIAYRINDLKKIWVKDNVKLTLVGNTGKYILNYNQLNGEYILQAINAETGLIDWERKMKGVDHIPLVYKGLGGHLILDGLNEFICLKLNTGELLWNLPKKKYSNYLKLTYIRLKDELILNVRRADEHKHILLALDINTGNLIWESEDYISDSQTPMIYNDYIYIFDARGSNLLKINPENGITDKKVLKFDDNIKSFYIIDDYVYYSKEIGGVYQTSL
jgi:outer membrane protein assembly factor BamB